MSVSAKLEADSARLRKVEDAINSQLSHVRGKIEGLQAAEMALEIAASAIEAQWAGTVKHGPVEDESAVAKRDAQ